MQYLSELTTQASGSAGGVTASHNQHTRYIRARKVPVDPATTRQRVVRSHFRTASFLWLNTLSPADRASWDVYAANVMLPNALGEPVHMTGRHHFFRTILAKYMATQPLDVVRAAPTVFNLGANTPPTFTAEPAVNRIRCYFDETDAWRNEGQGFLLIYFAPQQTASVNFFKGPFYFEASLEGSTLFPPQSGVVIRLLGFVSPGTRFFFRTITIRADGRVTHPKYTWCDLTP